MKEVCLIFLITFNIYLLFIIEYRTEEASSVSLSPSQGFIANLKSGTRMMPPSSTVADRNDPEQKKRLDLLFKTRRSYLQNGLHSFIFLVIILYICFLCNLFE